MANRWLNPAQPQTLQIVVFLLYFDAFFDVLRGNFASPIGLAIIVGSVAAAWGIANEKKWAYGLAVGIAGFGLVVLYMIFGANVLNAEPIGLMIAVAKLALLLHPQSRDYQRIWFK